MTLFSEIFRETCFRAEFRGRKPVVCLLGPDMQEAIKQCGEWLMWVEDFKPGDLGTFRGVRLRKMNQNGLAILT